MNGIKAFTEISIIFLIFSFISVFAQTTNYYNFTLSDSTTIVGFVSYEDEKVIQIKTSYGNEIRINKLDIISKTIADSVEIEKKLTNLKTSYESKNSKTENTDTSGIIRLELTDGSSLIGKIDSEHNTSITFTLLSKSEIII